VLENVGVRTSPQRTRFKEIVTLSNLEIIMPIAVLVLSFLSKLFIDRSTTMPQTIESILEFPVDITFLAISLIVGFTISPTGNPRDGMAWFALYMIFAILIVFLWRRSVKCFDNGWSWWLLFCAIINYPLAIYALINAIQLVSKGV
jgi:hypothetical protein